MCIKVFVFNGYGSYGGSFMLYQIGRICHEAFGSEVYIVQDDGILGGKRRFQYPYPFSVITVEEMKRKISTNDLFICHSADSRFNFGSQFPCKKIMYIQGVSAYKTIDLDFDHFVSVSQFVKEHTLERFGIDAPVIHPFINHNLFKGGLPWDRRRDEFLVLNYKKETIHELAKLAKRYKIIEPFQPLCVNKVGNQTQERLATLFGQYKYFLTLSPVEGFGLMPLEAMAKGAAVVGFEAFGGKDYFTDDNSFVVDSFDYDALITRLSIIQKNPDLGREVAENGRKTAQGFNYGQFKDEWIKTLNPFIDKVQEKDK